MQKNQASLSALPLLFALLACSGSATLAADAFSPSRFSVTVEGKGPDVIMIPGLASSSDVWLPEAAKLKSKYRLHLLQIAGFAGADKAGNAQGPILEPLVEELADYIRANKIKQPSVIGHSIGGLIGLMLIDKHPESAAKLLIVDSLPFYPMVFGPGVTVASVTPQAAAMREQLLKMTQAEFASSESTAMARLVKSKNEAADKAIAAAQASDHDVVARAMYEDFVTDVRADLPKIKTPIVVLYPFDPAMGLPQPMVSRLYESAYASLPNKKIIRVDGSFHFIQIDQPEIFHREVVSFLEQ